MKRLLIIILMPLYLSALVVGSEGSFSVENVAPTFPQSDTDNEVLGFVKLNGGFNLENADTTCTFNASFPVSGDICLNLGTLFLEKDLILTNTGKFISGGKIEGFGHSIVTPNNVSDFSLPTEAIRTFSLIDNAQELNEVWSVDWTFNSSYIIAGVNTSASDEVVVFFFDGNTLTETVQIERGARVNSVAAHPSDMFFGVVTQASANPELSLFFLDTNNGSITTGDTLATSATRAIAWEGSGNFFAIGRALGAGEVNAASFDDSTPGGGFTLGPDLNIAPNRNVGFDSLAWAPEGNNYLAAGLVDAPPEPGLLVCSFDPSSVSLTITVSVEIGLGDVQGVSWHPTGTYIAVVKNGGGTAGERLRVYEHNVSNGTLLELQSARVDLNTNGFGVDWSNDGESLLVGVANGGGSDLRVFSFDEDAGTLTLKNEFEMGQRVRTVRQSPNSNYVATGDNNDRVSVFDFSDNLDLINTNIIFNSAATITHPVIFDGDSVINGNGLTLELDNQGSFSVASGGSLTINNATISGVSETKLACGGDDASITLNNVKLVLGGDYTFDTGSILFQGANSITGTSKFIYSTSVGSTIDSNSEVCIDLGVTFSYDPPVARNDLIIMTDDTSRLCINSGTLHSTSTGIVLSRGTLVLEGSPVLSNDGSSLPEGIIFGDGVNDLDIILFPGVPLEVSSGFLDIKNLN